MKISKKDLEKEYWKIRNEYLTKNKNIYEEDLNNTEIDFIVDDIEIDDIILPNLFNVMI